MGDSDFLQNFEEDNCIINSKVDDSRKSSLLSSQLAITLQETDDEKLMCKGFEICLGKLSENSNLCHTKCDEHSVPIQINEKKSYVQENGLTETSSKKKVSFCNESNILFFDQDNAANALFNEESEVINISINDSSTDLSFSKTDSILKNMLTTSSNIANYCVNLELPSSYQNNPDDIEECRTLLEKQGNNIHAGEYYQTSLMEQHRLLDLKVLIQRLPDNLLEMQGYYLNKEISPKVDNSEIISANSSSLKSMKSKVNIKKSGGKTSKRKRNPSILHQQLLGNNPHITQPNSENLSTELETSKCVQNNFQQGKDKEPVNSNETVCNDNFISCKNVNVSFFKRPCVHLERLNLLVPEVKNSGISGSILPGKNVHKKKRSVLRVHKKKQNSCHSSRSTNTNKNFANQSQKLQYELSILKESEVDLTDSSSEIDVGSEMDIPLASLSKTHSNFQESLSEDDLPLLCFANVDVIQSPSSSNISNLQKQCVQVKKNLCSATGNSNYSSSSSSSSKRTHDKLSKKHVNCISNHQNISRTVVKTSANSYVDTSSAKKVKLDHSYVKSGTSNVSTNSKTSMKRNIKNGNIPKSKRKKLSNFSIMENLPQFKQLSTFAQNFVHSAAAKAKAKMSTGFPSKNKQNVNNRVVALKSCVQSYELTRFTNVVSDKIKKRKRKNHKKHSTSSKNKKYNKKAVLKKQAKVYDKLIKYLNKQIKPKKSKKKAKKPRKISKEKSKENELQPLIIKTEPDNDCSLVELGCFENASTKENSLSRERIESPVPEATHTNKFSQNKSQAKSKMKEKYRLGFLSNRNSLRFHNKCLASKRLLLSKCKTKKKKKIKKLFRLLKKAKLMND